MKVDPNDLRDIEVALGDRLFIQVASWRLYLGDAGIAKSLALECSAKFDQGPSVAARHGLETVQVQIAAGPTSLPLVQLIPSSQVIELEEILAPYCR